MNQLLRLQPLANRAAALAPTAFEQPESTLLAAAHWLMAKFENHPSRGLRGEIALHFLLLSEHPDVRSQWGLPEYYHSLALAWLGEGEAEIGVRAPI